MTLILSDKGPFDISTQFEFEGDIMKKAANRPRDLDDIEHLEMLINEEDEGGTNT